MTPISWSVFVIPADHRRQQFMPKPHINALSQTRYPPFELQKWEHYIVLVCYSPSPKFFEGFRGSVEFDSWYLGFCGCR